MFTCSCNSLGSTATGKISGPWYFIADGNEGSHAYNPIPKWLDNSGNAVSLAFINPIDILSGTAVPVPFINATSHFRSLGKKVFFSIGGYSYANRWPWLMNPAQAQQAGKISADIAKTYGVGIEIDYEGGPNPTDGIVNFIKGFRSSCPMLQCWLSIDLYGSPGGADWQKDLVPKVLPPTGSPGEGYGDGNWVDFVNVMVIDGQPVSIAITFWQQWINSRILNLQRATFGLIAGWPGLGICLGDAASQDSINTAVRFLSPYNIFGILSWAVCPQRSCGDWNESCDQDSPGFNYLCTKLGSC